MSREISTEEVKRSVKLLFETSYAFESALLEKGYPRDQVEEWLFHVREILTDIRTMQVGLADLFGAFPLEKVPNALNGFGDAVRYEHIPHLEWHMSQMGKSLKAYLPEDEDSED